MNIFFQLSTEKIRNEKIAEFELGKQHLARMMGKDPNEMTSEDIEVKKNIYYSHHLIDKSKKKFL